MGGGGVIEKEKKNPFHSMYIMPAAIPMNNVSHLHPPPPPPHTHTHTNWTKYTEEHICKHQLRCFSNRWVFSFFLKVEEHWVFLRDKGKAKTEKDLLPKVSRQKRGTESREVSREMVWMKKVWKVRWHGVVRETLKAQASNFVLDLHFN